MKNVIKLSSLLNRVGGGRILFGTYQREYCWGKKNYNEFIYTLERAIKERKDQPFGVIAYYETENEDAESEIYVVDGQQRITTFSLFVAALSSFVKEPELKIELERLLQTTNSSPLLYYCYSTGDYENQNVILEEIIKDKEAPRKSKSPITKAYKYFLNYLSEKTSEISPREIWVGLKRLVVMEMICDNQEEALTAFRNINGYGVKVTAQDNVPPILESAIYREYEDEMLEEELIRLYNEIRKELFINKSLIDDFAYVVYEVTIVRRSSITGFIEEIIEKEGINLVLRKLYRFTQWLKEYQPYLENYISGTKYKKDLYLKSLYQRQEFIRVLSDLIGPWNKLSFEITQDELFKILRFYRNINWKLTIVGSLSGSSHRSKLDGLIKAAQKKNCPNLYTGIKELINEGQYPEFINYPEETIIASLSTRNAYSLGFIKELLLLLNQNLTEGEDITDLNKLTIEHVLPRSTKEKPKQLLNNLGNLTLLTQSFNSRNSNKPFIEKKEIFKTSQLTLNRYFDNKENWTKNDIEERCKYLIELIINTIFNE